MWDWDAWQTVGQSAWDWGSKIGLGGVGGWFLKRWLGSRDSAADRGRECMAAARPEVVPTGGTFLGDFRGTISLQNRGPGAARDIRVTFTGSAAVARVPEIVADQRRETQEMKLGDSPFFHRKLSEPAELTARFCDCFGHEYVVALPFLQEPVGNRFGPLPAWGPHRLIKPKVSTKRLREIGGP